MTRETWWQRFYRAIGGRGLSVRDGATLRDRRSSPSRPEEHVEGFFSASHLARLLVRAGFLMRDPSIDPDLQPWFINFRWQWRFWRGAYWAVLAIPKTAEGRLALRARLRHRLFEDFDRPPGFTDDRPLRLFAPPPTPEMWDRAAAAPRRDGIPYFDGEY